MKSQNKITKEFHEKELETFEADIRPHTRFIIDNDLLGNIDIEGDYETSQSQRVNRVYKNRWPAVQLATFSFTQNVNSTKKLTSNPIGLYF